MCIISDTSLRDLVFPEERYIEAKTFFEKGDWKSINGKILIYPFDLKNLGPFTYDLSIGNEAFNVRTKRKISIGFEKTVIMKANDIFLFLAQEYVALPPDFSGSVLPKFSLVREGMIQSMTKIDPTWFGKIAVALINYSGKRFRFTQGCPFCTLVIQRLDKPCSKILNSSETPALGKDSIEYILKEGRAPQTRECLR